jgi:hypothetical protein
MGPATFPLTTIENDPDIAPVPELLTQFLVSVQTVTGDYEEEQVSDSHMQGRRGLTCHFSGAVCTQSLYPSLSF